MTTFTRNGSALVAALRRLRTQRLWALPFCEPLTHGLSFTFVLWLFKLSDVRDTVRLKPAMCVAPVLMAACSRNLRRQASSPQSASTVMPSKNCSSVCVFGTSMFSSIVLSGCVWFDGVCCGGVCWGACCCGAAFTWTAAVALSFDGTGSVIPAAATDAVLVR